MIVITNNQQVEGDLRANIWLNHNRDPFFSYTACSITFHDYTRARKVKDWAVKSSGCWTKARRLGRIVLLRKCLHFFLRTGLCWNKSSHEAGKDVCSLQRSTYLTHGCAVRCLAVCVCVCVCGSRYLWCAPAGWYKSSPKRSAHTCAAFIARAAPLSSAHFHETNRHGSSSSPALRCVDQPSYFFNNLTRVWLCFCFCRQVDEKSSKNAENNLNRLNKYLNNLCTCYKTNTLNTLGALPQPVVSSFCLRYTEQHES